MFSFSAPGLELKCSIKVFTRAGTNLHEGEAFLPEVGKKRSGVFSRGGVSGFKQVTLGLYLNGILSSCAHAQSARLLRGTEHLARTLEGKDVGADSCCFQNSFLSKTMSLET